MAPTQDLLEERRREQRAERSQRTRFGLEDEDRHLVLDAAALATARDGGIDDVTRREELQTIGGAGSQRHVGEFTRSGDAGGADQKLEQLAIERSKLAAKNILREPSLVQLLDAQTKVPSIGDAKGSGGQFRPDIELIEAGPQRRGRHINGLVEHGQVVACVSATATEPSREFFRLSPRLVGSTRTPTGRADGLLAKPVEPQVRTGSDPFLGGGSRGCRARRGPLPCADQREVGLSVSSVGGPITHEVFDEQRSDVGVCPAGDGGELSDLVQVVHLVQVVVCGPEERMRGNL